MLLKAGINHPDPNGKGETSMHSFKDFMVVDYRPGEDDYTKYRAQKRKRGSDDTSGTITAGKEYATEDQVIEALNTQQRIKLKQALRRNKARIQLGRRKAARRIATQDVIKKRAQRRARQVLLKKLLKGKSKADLPYSTRAAYEKMVNKRQTAVNRIAKKLLPMVRKQDREKLQRKGEQK
jgi:hypothetical protein